MSNLLVCRQGQELLALLLHPSNQHHTSGKYFY